MKTLFAWIGLADLRGTDAEGVSKGPILAAAQSLPLDAIQLISDHPEETGHRYSDWLTQQTTATISMTQADLTGPTEFGEIYEAAIETVKGYFETRSKDDTCYFHLSPGTPAMAAVWILLSKTKYPAVLIESSPEAGLREVSFPFDLAVEYLPDLLRDKDRKLIDLSEGPPPAGPEFSAIIHRCSTMKRVLARAAWIAVRAVPVLIQGESGTGKELLARAIHQASPRNEAPFVAVNCGAIPPDLLESEFFGHRRGAFTGADSDRVGHFEEASGGTLFLDEIGELPLNLQVKLLRVLQEGQVYPLGSSKPVTVNVRILGATNRDLIAEVATGAFREDLFHRIAVGILNLPPLRDRSGDLSLLVDAFSVELNAELADQPGYIRRRVKPSARKALLSHDWPGNVRELRNTLLRAFAWSQSPEISTKDIEESLIVRPGDSKNIMGLPFSPDFDIRKLLAEVVRHYFTRALKQSGQKKSAAAKLVGLPNYQTFDNWAKKYEL